MTNAWALEQAMSVLLSARKRLLDEDPDLANDEALFRSMLSNETEDIIDVLDNVIRAYIVANIYAEGAKKAKENLTSRQERYERRADNLRAMAFAAMQALGMPRHERPDFLAFTGAAKQAVIITDESMIPEEFMRVTRAPKKTEIATALKAGQDVPGASLGNGIDTFTIKTK